MRPLSGRGPPVSSNPPRPFSLSRRRAIPATATQPPTRRWYWRAPRASRRARLPRSSAPISSPAATSPRSASRGPALSTSAWRRASGIGGCLRRRARASGSGIRSLAADARSTSNSCPPIPPDRSPWAMGATPCWAIPSPGCTRPPALRWCASITSTTADGRCGCWRSRCGCVTCRNWGSTRSSRPTATRANTSATSPINWCCATATVWPRVQPRKSSRTPPSARFSPTSATPASGCIRFDVYTNELDLIKAGKIDAVIEGLRKRGLIAEYDGAVWLRGEPLGLPKDRVLIRSGPEREPTYRTPDIAYHIDKLERGFDLIVDVFGADHIAEHEGVIAAVRALGYDTSPIRAIIYQFVTLTRGGEKVKMSTRKATYVTLDELIDEVGADVVRFFFLFRKSDTHLDFDLDLARKQAPENPVFYVQYAHARLSSIFREAEKAGLAIPSDSQSVKLEMLSEEELALARRATTLPEVMTASARELEPHRIPFYLLELAGDFHRYYNKPSNRIIGPDRDLSIARLFLARLLKTAIAAGLELLGVSAPVRM